MSAALVRRWFKEVWNERRPETIDELFARDGIAHGLPGEPRGPAGFRAFQAAFLTGFPELTIEVDETLEGPPDARGVVTVAARFTAHVLHGPTGRRGTFESMCFSRWHRGQIAEAWNVCDFFGLEQQLGCAPF
jgi:predicted ester cyclase